SKDDRNMYAYDVLDGFHKVPIDAAALSDRVYHAVEVVIQQYEVGRLTCEFAAACAHGDADVGGLQRGAIVHTITGHGHHVALYLQGLHHAQLRLGEHTGETVAGVYGIAQGRIIHMLHRFTIEHRSCLSKADVPC